MQKLMEWNSQFLCSITKILNLFRVSRINKIFYRKTSGTISSSNKFDDKIKGFNEKNSKILIGHIEDYLTKLGIDMGMDDNAMYNISYNQGQVNI